MSYSYKQNLVAPTKLIFDLQEEAREKIKQEKTKLLVYLSKFQNLFVQIKIYEVFKKIFHDLHVY